MSLASEFFTKQEIEIIERAISMYRKDQESTLNYLMELGTQGKICKQRCHCELTDIVYSKLMLFCEEDF